MRRTDVIAANMLGLGVIFTKPAFPNALLLNPMYLGLQHPHARASDSREWWLVANLKTVSTNSS